jgi:hypothetical protein
VLEGADQADFGGEEVTTEVRGEAEGEVEGEECEGLHEREHEHEHVGEEGELRGAVSDYMIHLVWVDWDFFRDWRL